MAKYKTPEAINNNDTYRSLLDKRGKNHINQKTTKRFNIDGDIPLNLINHKWTHGDKLYKLSYMYYESYDYWWVIAYFNSKPTDAHYKYGDVVAIPFPLSDALMAYGETL